MSSFTVQSIDLPTMECMPDDSGRRDNRMAAQHLHRYLERPSSGLERTAHEEDGIFWFDANGDLKSITQDTQAFSVYF